MDIIWTRAKQIFVIGGAFPCCLSVDEFDISSSTFERDKLDWVINLVSC